MAAAVAESKLYSEFRVSFILQNASSPSAIAVIIPPPPVTATAPAPIVPPPLWWGAPYPLPPIPIFLSSLWPVYHRGLVTDAPLRAAVYMPGSLNRRCSPRSATELPQNALRLAVDTPNLQVMYNRILF